MLSWRVLSIDLKNKMISENINGHKVLDIALVYLLTYFAENAPYVLWRTLLYLSISEEFRGRSEIPKNYNTHYLLYSLLWEFGPGYAIDCTFVYLV